MGSLDSEINRLIQIEINKIIEIGKEALHDGLLECVYNYYSPNTYDIENNNERTNQLINSVDGKIDDEGNVVIFINTDKLSYHNVLGEDTSNKIPWLVENGHDDGIGEKEQGKNQFHRYEARNYLELAQQIISDKLGVECEIINDNPYE